MSFQGYNNDRETPRGTYNGFYGGYYPSGHPNSFSGLLPPLYANPALGYNPNYIQQPGPPPAISPAIVLNPEAEPFVPSSNRAAKGLRTIKENKARNSCKHRKDGCLQFWGHTTGECGMSWMKRKERDERKKKNKAERETAKEKEEREEGEKEAVEEKKCESDVGAECEEKKVE
jgi:hypothetical protein